MCGGIVMFWSAIMVAEDGGVFSPSIDLWFVRVVGVWLRS